jgi:cytochrome c oxidase subunit 2
MMAPGGPAAHRIAALGWFVLITFLIVTAIMWVLVFWLALRRRGTLAEYMPWDAPEDRRWIIVGGFIIPVVILATIFVTMLHTMSEFPMGDNERHLKVDIQVIGHQWWWEVHYIAGGVHQQVVTANEIHIPAGRPVVIGLTSADVIHSFWVPRLHGKVDLNPGMVNHIRLQADRPGTYRGECAEYCGPQHAHMILSVVADPPAKYEAWLERQRRPAAEPASAAAARGRQLFMSGPCVVCHSIRGTDARGQVGPDLTHIGSRTGIAANAYPNTTGSLEAWIVHAQSLKPYARMPNITAFKGDEVRALTTYLQSLK